MMGFVRACIIFVFLTSVLTGVRGFDLTLVHTADTYSALSAVDASSGSCQPTNASYVTSSGEEAACFGGVARMKTVIDEQRSRSANVLVVDAGNIISTSLYYYVSGPSLVASYYVQLGYDLVHLQVQDFVLPLENVIQFVRDTNAGAPALSFVVTNLEGYNSDARANGTYIAKWAFKTFAGGERVGFAATVANNLASMVRTPLEIRATEEAAALSVAVMALINKGANKIVASVSSNATAQVILASVPGIDILIVPTQLQANDLSGIRSSAVAPYPLVFNTTWEQPVLVVSSGTYGRLIGVLDVVFDDNGVITSWSGDAVLMDESVTPNAAIQSQLLANYAQLQANFSQIVGWSSIDLGFETNCLFAECAIGDWMGDAVRSFAARTWGGNVQVALNNGGSIRGTFARGPITLGQEQTAFPFATNSDLYTFQLQGQYLLAALENGLSLATDPSSDVNNGAGRFLQVSGVRYSWNPSEEVGYRVVDVEVEVTPGVWATLDMTATYNVSTFDWMVIYGGDDYTMLRDNSTRLLKNGDNMMAVLLEALAKNITSVDVNRITVTTASRRACFAADGSVCNNNGDCVGGQCHCTVAGTVSARLCALDNSTAASSDSSNTTLAIALGVSLPVAALILLVVLVILAITRMRRRREHNSWEIDMAELEMGSQLGAGGFGEVHRAVWKGTDVAVKVVSAHNTGKAAWDNFKQEVSVMTALRHPNVVLFMAASTKPPKMCIVMELMELGSLYDLLHNELVPAIPLPLCLKMAYQAAKGMHFLHSSGIVHRDLKSLNLLLDNKWNLKASSPSSLLVVSDFGLTKFKADLKRAGGEEVQGTIHWTSPEVLEDRLDVDYVQADVYSFGIIMWELLTREQPYAGVSTAAIAVGVIRDALRPSDLQSEGGQHHAEFEVLMTECWSQDPSARPSFLEIMSRLSAMSEDMGNDNSMTTSGSSSTYFGVGGGSYKLSAGSAGSAASSSSSHISSKSGGSSKAPDEHHRNQHRPHGVAQSSAAPTTDEPLTVVFTDVAHATQLWEAEPHAMREAVAMHNDLLRRLLKQHRGYESVFLKHNAGGEGYFCFVFTRALDALRWCDEVQRALLTQEWPKSLLGVPYAREEIGGVADSVLFRGPRVRMGVHHGLLSRTRDPLSNRFEYAGSTVKVATELTLRAEGGHVLVSDAVLAVIESPPAGDGQAVDPDRSAFGRHRFQHVGAVEVALPANGGSMFEVAVHDMRLGGLEDRCQGWEHAGSLHTRSGTSRSGTNPGSSSSSITGTGGSATGGTHRPRLLARPDETSYIGGSNACRWIIPFEDLVIQDAHVGQGSYGFVSQGRWKGVDVAVKRFVKQRLDEETMLRFREEAALLAELRHPHVVLFIGACVRSPNVCIVTEWIPKGSLRDVLADGSVKLSWATRLNVIKGIALGLAYLHAQQPAPILHRDLKSSNVLVDESWTAKIADFGLARMKQENATMTRCGTPAWIAPEVILRERYTEKADLYSLGIVMWEVATRKLPFAGENLAKTAVDVVEGKRPPVPPNVPRAYAALMTACWHRKPHKRPTADDVCRTIESLLDHHRVTASASGEVSLV